MKLTQELIDQIQEAMLHTNLKGQINWKDGDDIEVQIAGTFAKVPATCTSISSPSFQFISPFKLV